MKYFAIQGHNHESFGFDWRTGEWSGAELVSEGQYKEINLTGKQALLALLEAKVNPIIETLSTGAVAMGPMQCMTPPPPKKKKPVHEGSEAPVNSITGEVTDKTKEVIADEEKPGESAKPKKQWEKPWLKKDEPEESARPNGSKKSSAIHRPQIAGPKSPTFKEAIARGIKMEEFTPEDIGNLITEDPDTLSDSAIIIEDDTPVSPSNKKHRECSRCSNCINCNKRADGKPCTASKESGREMCSSCVYR